MSLSSSQSRVSSAGHERTQKERTRTHTHTHYIQSHEVSVCTLQPSLYCTLTCTACLAMSISVKLHICIVLCAFIFLLYCLFLHIRMNCAHCNQIFALFQFDLKSLHGISCSRGQAEKMNSLYNGFLVFWYKGMGPALVCGCC